MTPPRILILAPLYIHTLLEGPSSIAMLVVPGWLFPEVVPQDLNLVRGLGGCLLALTVLAVLAISNRVTMQLLVTTVPLAVFHLTSLGLVIHRWISDPDVLERLITSIVVHSVLGLWFAFLIVAFPKHLLGPRSIRAAPS